MLEYFSDCLQNSTSSFRQEAPVVPLNVLSTNTMSSAMNFPFNDLPFELQREIFLVAAEADRSHSIRLALVARRFHIWWVL